jgi:hypothetical protein
VPAAFERFERLPDLDLVRINPPVVVQLDRPFHGRSIRHVQAKPREQFPAHEATLFTRELDEPARAVLDADEIGQEQPVHVDLALEDDQIELSADFLDVVPVATTARGIQVSRVVNPVGKENDLEDLVLGRREDFIESRVHSVTSLCNERRD